MDIRFAAMGCQMLAAVDSNSDEAAYLLAYVPDCLKPGKRASAAFAMTAS